MPPQGRMRFWRCLLAAVLSVAWFWSGFGHFSLQAGVWLLCFLLVFPPACDSCERSTQTSSEAPAQSTENGHVVGKDETDTGLTEQKALNRSQYPNVQRSLHQLFNCAYIHLVQPWYTVPKNQPLYVVLRKEFDLIVDKIISKAEKFDLSVTSMGCINIFTQHLRCAKQSTRSPLFSSKAEEMAAFRNFSEALIRNLFPQHLWDSEVYHCAIQEILALKVLALVTLLSDPDNLNRLVVRQLDQVPSVNLAEVHDSDKEDTYSSSGSQNIEVFQKEVEESPFEEIKTKKTGNKVKKKFSKFFDTLNPKRGIKKKQKELRMQALSSRRAAVIELETDGASSPEDYSFESDSDVESCMSRLQEDMMEFKLSLEMWRVGNWAVTVTNVEMKEEKLCFTIHLEEKNNRENLHWDVKKSQLEIVEFYNCCKDVPHLPSISTITKNTDTELNVLCQEEARAAFESFLQVLVTDTELGPTQLVFEFLCPLRRLMKEEEHEGGVWVLLGGLASFLTPGHEDDDEVNTAEGEEKPNEHVDICSTSEALPQHDGLDPAKAPCMDSFQRLNKEMEEEYLATDSGSSPSYDQTDDSTSEKEQIDYTDHLFDGSDRMISTRSQSIDENLAHFAARTRVLPKKLPAVSSSVDSDDQDGYEIDGISDLCTNENVKKKEPLIRKKSSGTHKSKGKEKKYQAKEELRSSPQVQKQTTGMPNMGQPEISKVIFDLLKEISGNSCILKIMKTALTPFMPLIKKKLNTFLKKLNPSEVQIAENIDHLRDIIWPEEAASQEQPRSTEEKNETKEKAMYLISSKLAGYPIFSKTDAEALFRILQDTEENKKLVYMLLSYILREFLAEETACWAISKLHGKNSF